MEKEINKKDDLSKSLDEFLNSDKQETIECNDFDCIIKNDKSLVERLNKKIITDDGRQLLL